MNVGAVNPQDKRIDDLIERTCAKIRTKFPHATFAFCLHPTQRGAIIDAYVPTDDDFEVLDLVHPELDDLLLEEDIAIYVRVVSPLKPPVAFRGALYTT
jgi:hypothetical protein